MNRYCTMGIVIAVALLAGALALRNAGVAQEQGEQGNVETFMRAKLEHSQKVLEGLTTEDFDMIAKGAGQMEVLSQEAAWQVLQTPEYRQQSLEFRRSAQALREAANKKNLDGAALYYVDVTLKCVRCHQYVRHVKSADASDALRPLIESRETEDVAE
jgi:hypothetical protein